jgi:hypothetical protein
MKDLTMKHDMRKTKFGLSLLTLGGVMLIGGISVDLRAQTPEVKETPAKARSYAGGRDPFKRYEAPKIVNKKVVGAVGVPSIQERISMYKAQKAAAMNARMQAPKPTTALLLNEIQVVGISRTPRGYAAIVEATPIKLSYVIYPGEQFFDGQLVAIEDSRLIFRRATVLSNGRREYSAEVKPLRQANTVNAMANAGPVPAAESSAAASKP